VRIAQILSTEFEGLSVSSTWLQPVEIFRIKNLLLGITLKYHGAHNKKGEVYTNRDYIDKLYVQNHFVSFPIYHLLFDALLSEENKLEIFCNATGKKLIDIFKSDWEMYCQLNEATKKSEDILDDLTFAFYRSGLLMSRDWEKVANNISQFDDIIVGVDTNILMDAGLSEQLLSSLTLVDVIEYVHTPNWMLIIVPSAVIHEIEQASNSRDEQGRLTHRGCRGFRALQEILELGQSADWMGINLMISGGANPSLDTRVGLRTLRDELYRESAVSQSYFSATLDELRGCAKTIWYFIVIMVTKSSNDFF
jgi:hypothetical protein